MLTANYTNIEDFKTLCYEYHTPANEEEREKMTMRQPFYGSGWGTNEETGDLIRLNPVTHTLVFGLAEMIGISKITKENAEEVYTRWTMVQFAFGPQVTDHFDNSRRSITWEDIKAHIGLEVNGKEMTKRQFHGLLIKAMRSHVTPVSELS
jgi:hypothetical protein|tara:strand:- start:256 stop:708 length:453 start_codon:yes stop_codon:yes gene_type:complete